MKKIAAFLLFCFLLVSTINFGQSAEAKFTVSVSADSILFDNIFKVTFTLENAKGTEFIVPAFDAFNQIGGQSMSTRMSIVNGEMTQFSSYSFYLEPKEIGRHFIEPASIIGDGVVLETLPFEVFVLDNPEGIKQKIEEKGNRSDPFFEQFDMDLPPQFNWGAPDKKKKGKKSKRKTYRL